MTTQPAATVPEVDATTPFVPSLPVAVSTARQQLAASRLVDVADASLITLAARFGGMQEALRQVVEAWDTAHPEPTARDEARADLLYWEAVDAGD